MNKKYFSYKYWGPAIVILAVLISSIVSITQSRRRMERAERFEEISDIFFEKTDVDADQNILKHIEFYGFKANYEPKWKANTFNLDTEFGETYLVSFNANGDDYMAAFSVTWYKADPSLTIDDMMKRCRRQLEDQYKESGVVTRFTETIPDAVLERQGESLDLTVRAGNYVINKRVIIFRENNYEFRVEKASDISRESLDSFFDDLEFRVNIDGITR